MHSSSVLYGIASGSVLKNAAGSGRLLGPHPDGRAQDSSRNAGIQGVILERSYFDIAFYGREFRATHPRSRLPWCLAYRIFLDWYHREENDVYLPRIGGVNWESEITEFNA